MRRPTIAMLLAVAMLAMLTVTAFAVSGPGLSDPKPTDLPRIVSTADAGSDTTPSATAQAPDVTPSADTTRTSPSKDQTSSSNGASSSSGGHTSSSHASTSHSSSADDESSSSDHDEDDHDEDDHEVVKPHLHESDGNEHSSDHED